MRSRPSDGIAGALRSISTSAIALFFIKSSSTGSGLGREVRLKSPFRPSVPRGTTPIKAVRVVSVKRRSANPVICVQCNGAKLQFSERVRE